MSRKKNDNNSSNGRRGAPRGYLVNGEFMLARRRQLGLTREQLAERTGVDARTIQRCERKGNNYRARLATLEPIARALNVTVDDLILSSTIEMKARLDQAFLAPPPPPDPWVGRSQEADEIIARIAMARPCCIAGAAGIGKTALARFVAKKLAPQFAHGVVWLKASHQNRPVDIDEAQLRMAEALDFQKRLPDARITDRTTRMRAFARELWARPRLVILDDVVSAELITQLLPATGNAAMLVTTHLVHVADHFDDALELGGLSLDDTETILVHHIGQRRVERDRQGVQELHEALGGVPRSVYIAGRILQRERLVELGEYAARIRKDPTAGQYPSLLRTAENSLVVSFSQTKDHVSPAAWSLLGALSLFDDVPFSLQWAAVAGALPSTDAVKEPLSELIDVYLAADCDVPISSAPDSAASRCFRLRAHVPLFARTILGDRRAAVFELVARHAVDTARQASAQEDWSAITAERELWAHLLDTMVAFVANPDAIRDWDGCSRFPEKILPGFGNGCLVDVVTLLLPCLQQETLPQLGVWLRGAIACAQALERTLDEGRLLLALGRFWLRVRMDMPRAIECFDVAARRFVDSGAPGLASVALSEAGRALLASLRHAEGMERFERALALARAGHDRGPERACRINNAAASFTRQADVKAWRRAASLLEDAVAACTGTDQASTLLRVVCTLNLTSVRQALASSVGTKTSKKSGAAVDITAIDSAMEDWYALDMDTPLFDARIRLVRAALSGDPGGEGRALAKKLWHEQLDDTPLAEQDLLWLIGEAAFHCKLHLRSLRASGEPSPNIARGLALSDVSREVRVQGGDFVPLGLLFPVAPLVEVFDADFLTRARARADEVYGPVNRVSAELAELAELLGHPPVEPDEAGEAGETGETGAPALMNTRRGWQS